MYRSNIFASLPFRGFSLLFFLLFCLVQNAAAAQVRIAWNQSSDPAVTGYKVHHGTISRNYSVTEDARSDLTYLVAEIPDTQPYYVAVTAYSASEESDYSEELTVLTIQAAVPANGQILPAGTTALTMGGSQTYSIVPAPGFEIEDVFVNGTSVGPLSQFSFSNVDACHTISAVFVPVPVNFTISASAMANGSISPSGSVSAPSGTSREFTITPTANYRVADVMVDGFSVGAVTSYLFSNVAADRGGISATNRCVVTLKNPTELE